MNWSDERYVKLYTRDTLTWLSLSFEARAVLALMLRKVNGAGIMETGTLDPARAVAMQIVAPVEVVAKALPELIAIETVEMVPNGVALTNFVAAQEATKTEARKKRDQRQNDLDQRRQAQLVESLRPPVPARPELSRAVPLQPSPAQLTTTTSSPPPPAQPTTSPAKAKKPKAEQQQLPVVPPPPPEPPRPPSRVARLHQLFAELREARLVLPPPDGLGAPFEADEPVDWKRSGAALGVITKYLAARWPKDDEATQDSRIESAMLEWLEEPYWASPVDKETQKPTTPFPWGAFLTEKQFDKACRKAFPEEAAA